MIDESASIWECKFCTFVNHFDLNLCEICNSQRKHFLGHLKTTASNSTKSSSLECRIFSLVKESMLKSRTPFKLSNPPCAHITQKGTFGAHWSCGFRNIQMICTSLMCLDQFRNVLFSGDGVVPDLRGLQFWIEKAWQDGFDQEVCHNVTIDSPH